MGCRELGFVEREWRWDVNFYENYAYYATNWIDFEVKIKCLINVHLIIGVNLYIYIYIYARL